MSKPEGQQCWHCILTIEGHLTLNEIRRMNNQPSQHRGCSIGIGVMTMGSGWMMGHGTLNLFVVCSRMRG
jgi:hypothetical protein